MHPSDRNHLVDLARRVLGSAEEAEDWLERPSVQLGGRRPRDLFARPDGAARIEELLAQIDDDERRRGH